MNLLVRYLPKRSTDDDRTHPVDLYAERSLAEGYPGLDTLAHETFTAIQGQADHEQRIERLLLRLNRLTPLPAGSRFLVVGCGPIPQSITLLRDHGYVVTGIEPVASFVEQANAYLGSSDLVLQGSAEAIPLADASQDVILLESVLEHVDSPQLTLVEIHRVLKPGGLVYITTTNRYVVRYPDNGEYTVPFFGKLPRLVKECYVFQHLHYQPTLASYTVRPAVHWFTYADLCALGREVGFHRFYSSLDLRRRTDDLSIASPLLRSVARKLVGASQRNPWLRALVLTQMGGEIIMLKRGRLV